MEPDDGVITQPSTTTFLRAAAVPLFVSCVLVVAAAVAGLLEGTVVILASVFVSVAVYFGVGWLAPRIVGLRRAVQRAKPAFLGMWAGMVSLFLVVSLALLDVQSDGMAGGLIPVLLFGTGLASTRSNRSKSWLPLAKWQGSA